MPSVSQLTRRALRLSAITSACVAALATSLPAAGGSTTVSVNIWQGEWLGGIGTDTNWFNAANWLSGPLVGLPDPGMPVYFGPTQVLVEGIPTDAFLLPTSEAVLGGAFTAPSLDMRAWDGISQLRLTTGALLTTSATIGGVNSAYTPTLPLQQATVVLAGGQLAGSWSFSAHSRVVVLGQYSQAQGSWSGNLDDLTIGAGASFTASTGGAVIGRVLNNGHLAVGPAQQLTLAGSLVNNGTLDVRGAANQAAVLQLSQDTVLSGSGQTVLGGRNSSFIGNSDNAAKTLTIASGHTLRGSGMLGGGRYSQYFRDLIQVVNQGTVLAEGAGGIGIMATSFDNRAGTVQVADGSLLELVAIGPLTGGTLQSLGTATLRGSGVFENVTLRGGFQLAGGSYTDATLHDANTITGSTAERQTIGVGGALVNHGILTIRGGSSANEAAAMQLLSDTTLSGNGQTVLGGRNSSFIGNSDNAAKTLTIASGHTLRGSGMLGGGRYSQYFRDAISVVNQGRILVEGANGIGMIGPGFENQGLLQVSAGSALEAMAVDGGIRQTATAAVTQVDGRLVAQSLWLDAGTLKGAGLVQANVIANAGTIAPGNSPGKLSIQGNLTLGDGSVLLVEVAGPLRGTQYDWLDVSGRVTLDGTLRIVFEGYTPQLGDSFSFLTSGTGSFAGAFDRLETPGYTLHLQQVGQTLSFTIDAITPVPEPTNWALLLLGMAGLAAWMRRRQAAGN